MRKMNLKSLLAVALLMTLTFGMLTACGASKEPEATEPVQENPVIYLGENQDIPCPAVPGAQFTTSNVVQWTFDQFGEENGVPYGKATENLVQEDAPISNWYCGDGTYQAQYSRVTPMDYRAFLDSAKKMGFQMVTNSDLNSDVLYAGMTYQGNYYTFTYIGGTSELLITVGKRAFSPYLNKDNASTAAADSGVAPTLTMLPYPEHGGDNYVIQLKNGHFILFDGGSIYNLAQLLDFLEEKTPEGQQIVIDAWFITHGHFDHVGWTAGFYRTQEELGDVMEANPGERIAINGVYYNMPDEAIIENTVYSWRSDTPTTGYRNKSESVWPYNVARGIEKMKTEDGSPTPWYRPVVGQVYYFAGMTVEIPYSQELITFADYQMDLNASSTWYFVRNENGNTFLETGDTENVNMDKVSRMYTPDYEILGGKPSIMSAPHHGHNVYDHYIDNFWAPIMFYTSKTMFSWAAEYTAANQKMHATHNVQYYCYGDGGYQYDFTTGQVTAMK